MHKITEDQFTTQVIQAAKLFGWRVAHFRSGRTATGWRTPVQGDGKGYPDLVLLRGGTQLIVELKVGRNRTSAEQDG